MAVERTRDKQRAAHFDVKPQHLKLYKYRDFSSPSEVDFQRLETLLQREAFWCARPDTLNDPEEFAWTCDYVASTETEELLTELLVRVNARPREQAHDRAAAAIATGRLAILAKPVIEGMIQQCRNEIGLVCFGTSPDNPCLWQRYGGGGAGVCIEIDVPVELIERQLFRVQYSFAKTIHLDQLMRAFLDPHHVQDVYTLALLSKPVSWATEAEIRFVSRKQEVSVRMDGSKITRVILGDALPPGVRRRIEEIAAALRYDSQSHANVA